MEYLVDRLLAAMPTVIGGRFKTLKTLIMLDLVVSMSSGTRFLNKWKCQKVKVGGMERRVRSARRAERHETDMQGTGNKDERLRPGLALHPATTVLKDGLGLDGTTDCG